MYCTTCIAHTLSRASLAVLVLTLALRLALCASLSSLTIATAATPKTCALYFDFHEKKSPSRVSHLYFGEIAEDGTFAGGQRADLGLHDDPQGQLTIAPDGTSLAFTANDNRTEHDHFGCCDCSSFSQSYTLIAPLSEKSGRISN